MNIEIIAAFVAQASVCDLVGLLGFLVNVAGFGALQAKMLDGNVYAASLV